MHSYLSCIKYWGNGRQACSNKDEQKWQHKSIHACINHPLCCIILCTIVYAFMTLSNADGVDVLVFFASGLKFISQWYNKLFTFFPFHGDIIKYWHFVSKGLFTWDLKEELGLSFCDFVGTREDKAIVAAYRQKEWVSFLASCSERNRSHGLHKRPPELTHMIGE